MDSKNTKNFDTATSCAKKYFFELLDAGNKYFP